MLSLGAVAEVTLNLFGFLLSVERVIGRAACDNQVRIEQRTVDSE